MSEISERVKELWHDSGLNMTAFATKLTIDRSNLNKKVHGEQKITKRDIDKLCKTLNVSYDWLVNGNGEKYMTEKESAMLEALQNKKAYNNKQCGVPYYDIDFCLGLREMYQDTPEVPVQLIDIPGYSKADFWCKTTGDSMCPIINSGDIIAMKEVKDWQSFLLMNEAYGIVTSNEQRMVKVIRPGSDTDHFILHSYNSEYPDQEIDKNMVLRIYKVIGAISIRSI